VFVDLGRITGSFHFCIVPMGALVFISSVTEGANFFAFGGMGQCNVTNVSIGRMWHCVVDVEYPLLSG